MGDAPDDLAPLLEELAATLEELRCQLDARRSGRIRDLLRFTERYAIPAAIAILEANVRLLELTASAIRTAESGGPDGTGAGRRSTAGPPAATVDALDAALADLGDALRGVPTDPDARRLLEEARSLRREIRDRLDATDASRGGRSTRGGAPSRPEVAVNSARSADGHAAAGRRGGTGYDVPVVEESHDGQRGGEAAADTQPEPGGVPIDVEAELESIKRDLDESRARSPGGEQGELGSTDHDGGGADPSESDTAGSDAGGGDAADRDAADRDAGGRDERGEDERDGAERSGDERGTDETGQNGTG